MVLESGAWLGPYEIICPLGAGGMGEVYRGRDPRLDRDVAIKVLPGELGRNPDRLARFEREARAVAALNHPNIVTIYTIEESAGTRFLTMELVEGRSLDRIMTPGGLPLRQILDLAIPLADALAAAHERGIVHRDLKPANVMVTREGRVKVLDFGLAKVTPAEPTPDANRTMTMAPPVSAVGEVVGTVPYMSPEQVRCDALDPRTDLFSLGIIIYEMATGYRPFSGRTTADVSSAILRDVPPIVQTLRGDLPTDLGRIIGRCLEKDPERRVQTAKDVRNELELMRRAEESGISAVSYAVRAPVSVFLGDLPSIAVLPFVNRSHDAEDEYFADGLADELLNVLAKIRGLRVAARRSSFTFKGKEVNIRDIGRALNVATVLEGSVRKAGSRVRIAVQLVKVSDGYQLWSETYDRTLEDIFAVQDDIAQTVVKELRRMLLGEELGPFESREVRNEVAAAAKGRGTDVEAHRLFLQGRYLVDRLAGRDISRGIDCLREALEADPGHALAWACLSQAHALEAALGFAPVAEGNARARAAAERALTLEPDLAEGHLALCAVYLWHDWNWKGADRLLRRARDLAPSNAEALHASGLLAYDLGQLDEAVALCRRAIELDPLSVYGHTNLGRACRSKGLLAEAEHAFRKALEISPEGIPLHLLLSWTLDSQGRREEALAEVMKEKADWARLCGLAIIHHTGGRSAESDRALRELTELHAIEAGYQIAEAHAARGETDAAFEWLERAYGERDPGLAVLKPEPYFRSLHADPRWTAFLGKMGLAD